MYLACDNKKCGKQFEARVTSTKPHRVICSFCGQAQETVSSFAINQLVMEKRFVTESKKAFAFFCPQCRGVLPGSLDSQANQVKCSVCEGPMNVSDFMIRQMKNIVDNAS